MARVKETGGGRWLVSAAWDVSVFGGSAALALGLLAFGRLCGLLDEPLPPVVFVGAIVFVDVAHVWATAWRVYLDPGETTRRPGVYLGIPLAAYTVGVILHSVSAELFWRALAYVAVWHFVRQQYGWLALYRRREGRTGALDRWLDNAAVYAATLIPVVWWHAHLPRQFEWFVAGDFVSGLPEAAATMLLPVAATIAAAWTVRQAILFAGGDARPGPWIVMVSTWLTWWLGIVVFDSDYAFTVTNVLVHGIPYVAYVWRWGRRRHAANRGGIASVFQPGRLALYLLPLAIVAWLEEWGWDRIVWHEHASLFPGPALQLAPSLMALAVPLLALPQATHYVLDAWIWRVRPENPRLARDLGLP